MRISDTFTKTTKREDIEAIKVFGLAVLRDLNTSYKREGLAQFKKYIIDRNGEMFGWAWEKFLKVIDDFDIPHPKLDLKNAKYDGSWYQIPTANRPLRKRMRNKCGPYIKTTELNDRLEMRRSFRRATWEAVMAEHDLNEAEVDRKLGLDADQIAWLNSRIDELFANQSAMHCDLNEVIKISELNMDEIDALQIQLEQFCNPTTLPGSSSGKGPGPAEKLMD